MSEFSDSYHLLASNIKDVKFLIQQSNRYGMVISSSGKYIPFIVEGLEEAGGPIDQLIQHNTQLLIHYAFAAEHGCWVKFFDKDIELACLSYQPEDNQLFKKLAAPLDNLLSRAIINESTASSLQNLATDLVVEEIGSKIAGVLGLQHVSWLSCTDLTYQSKKDLQKRFPDSEFVNVSKRGQIEIPAQCIPNEWCSEPDQPSFMYLPVPSVLLTVEQEAMVNRHFQYWTQFGDYDNETQQGFWMYELYRMYLPSRYRYLCNRLMNLLYTQPTKLLETLRAIIQLVGTDVNWEEYLRGF
ncbi:MAG: hypothetical protein V7K97_10115 [Nostoc sp.]|uniref:hypothetical protein n=1 Tax=Nostoc sp. TaxID=1180 RepID=UPI002FF8BA76